MICLKKQILLNYLWYSKNCQKRVVFSFFIKKKIVMTEGKQVDKTVTVVSGTTCIWKDCEKNVLYMTVRIYVFTRSGCMCGACMFFFMRDLEVGTLCSSASAKILIELEYYYECWNGIFLSSLFRKFGGGGGKWPCSLLTCVNTHICRFYCPN